MDASGKDVVFLETVGVGQAEVDIIDHADTVVLVLMPGSGDSIQALKAGVMEIPDIIVVNKADHPLTDTMVREIRGVLSLGARRADWRVPIVKTEAARGEGVEELVEQLDEHRAHIEAEGTLARAPPAQPAQRGHRALPTAPAPPPRGGARARTTDSQALLDEVVARRLDPASAASQILERFDAGEAAKPVAAAQRGSPGGTTRGATPGSGPAGGGTHGVSSVERRPRRPTRVAHVRRSASAPRRPGHAPLARRQRAAPGRRAGSRAGRPAPAARRQEAATTGAAHDGEQEAGGDLDVDLGVERATRRSRRERHSSHTRGRQRDGAQRSTGRAPRGELGSARGSRREVARSAPRRAAYGVRPP